MSRKVSAERPGKHPTAILAAAAFSVALLAGCAAGPGLGGTPTAGTPSTPAAGSAPGSPAAGNGSLTPSSPPTDVAAAGSPSASAKMVCGDETRTNITRILSLSAPPATTETWESKVYTCTYALPAGSLVLSVKETADPPAARAYFDALQQRTTAARPIEGMANLGLPAFETPSGTVVFVKDSFILTVDAAALPATLGPHNISRNAFAYEIATAVLACWSE